MTTDPMSQRIIVLSDGETWEPLEEGELKAEIWEISDAAYQVLASGGPLKSINQRSILSRTPVSD